MTYLILSLFSLSLFAAPFEIQEAWTDLSDPALMSRVFESRLHLLPIQGKVNEPQKYWSGDYWAMVKGGINHRWHADRNFSLPSPDKATAVNLTQRQIAQLSPAAIIIPSRPK